MKNTLSTIVMAIALQSPIPAWSQQQKPDDNPATSVSAAFPRQVDARAVRIDDYIKAEMAKRQIPGLALGIVRNGELVRAQGYGKSNLETDSAVSSKSVFDLASLTKPFTAEAVMMLVDDGKLNLNDSASSYVSGLPADWNHITIYELLSHTSGLPELFLGRCRSESTETT